MCQTACCPNPFSLGLKRFNDRSKEFLFGQLPVRKMKIQIRNLKPEWRPCITPLNGRYEFFGAPIRAKFTPLNRVPFGKFNGAGGPH